jgi:hypothetical protein
VREHFYGRQRTDAGILGPFAIAHNGGTPVLLSCLSPASGIRGLRADAALRGAFVCNLCPIVASIVPRAAANP